MQGMRHLAALVQVAGRLDRVQVSLTIPSTAHVAQRVEVTADGEVPEREQRLGDACAALLDEHDIAMCDDVTSLPEPLAGHARLTGIGAAAVARVRMADGTPVGHVMAARHAPHAWTSHDHNLMQMACALAQSIADASERDAYRAWIEAEQQLLEQVAAGAPLELVLQGLAAAASRSLDGMLCTVMLRTGSEETLHCVPAPGLPADFAAQLASVPIAPEAGACGAAAYWRRTVLCPDVRVDPNFRAWQSVIDQYGIVSCWSVPVYGAAGDVLGTFACYGFEPGMPSPSQMRFLQDATHIASVAIGRARAETVQRATESRLRQITESTDEVFYIHRIDGSADGAFDYVSPTIEELWSVSIEEMARDPQAWLRPIHPDDRARVLASTERTRFGEGYDHEYRIVREDGSVRWVNARAIPVADEDGVVRRLIGSARDVTPRKLIELALEENQARLAGIVGSAMDAIISVNRHREIVVFNAAAEHIFRLPAADALGTTIDRFLPEAQRAAHAGKVTAFSKTGETTRTMGRPGTLYAVRADGQSFPIEATISRTEVHGEPLLTVILRDVTERELLETQFRQSQKMEAMGRLAGGIAHDFNNLLTVIHGGAEFLRHRIEPQSALQRDVDEIMGAATRAAALTRQLLAFSRKQVLATRVFDLNDVIRDVERLLRRVIGEDVSLGVLLSAAPAHVQADPGQIEQVLMNLAVNARDAMPTGGTLLLCTSHTSSQELPAALPPWRGAMPDRVVLLSVTDAGVGMDEATRTRAFEPFFTTKGPSHGTGLGLATVYGIVEQSGGIIGIESAVGQGTTVHIGLPSASPGSHGGQTTTNTPPAERSVGNVLLAEDDDGVRAIVARTLSSQGYTVFEARRAAEAIALWHEHRGQAGGVDILVTDMVMPGGSGRELVNVLRSITPRLPVLFTSGYMEDGMRADDDATITLYLEKPFTTPNLLESVRTLLARSRGG
jgi:PAS domain S-box-containing protein